MSVPRIPSLSRLCSSFTFGGLPEIREVDQHHRLVDQIERAEPEAARERHRVERAVDIEPRRNFRLGAHRVHPKMSGAINGHGAQWSTRVHQEHGRLAVNLRAHQQVVLRRTLQGERLILRSFRPCWQPREGQRRKTGHKRDEHRGEIFSRKDKCDAGKHGPEDSTGAALVHRVPLAGRLIAG